MLSIIGHCLNAKSSGFFKLPSWGRPTLRTYNGDSWKPAFIPLHMCECKPLLVQSCGFTWYAIFKDPQLTLCLTTTTHNVSYSGFKNKKVLIPLSFIYDGNIFGLAVDFITSNLYGGTHGGKLHICRLSAAAQ